MYSVSVSVIFCVVCLMTVDRISRLVTRNISVTISSFTIYYYLIRRNVFPIICLVQVACFVGTGSVQARSVSM